MAQEQSAFPSRQSAILTGLFTVEEATRLRTIRTQLLKNPQYLDRVIDEKRMRFVKYLIEQGEITDAQSH